MPQNQPQSQSGFAAAVGGFLQGYGTVKQFQGEAEDRAIRKRQADRQDQMAQVQMGEAGYDVVPMPKIEAPPGQSFAQKIGAFLSGGPQEPSSIVMKTHASARENEIAGEQQFTAGQNALRLGTERDIAAGTQAGENARSAARNATDITVAGINHKDNHERAAVLGVQQHLSEKEKLIDDAIAAAGGDPVRAMSAVERIPGAASKYGLTRMDYYAGRSRFLERKATLAREGIQSREEIATMRNGGGGWIPPGTKPAATSSLRPLSPNEKAQAGRDPAYANALSQAGYKRGTDF